MFTRQMQACCNAYDVRSRPDVRLGSFASGTSGARHFQPRPVSSKIRLNAEDLWFAGAALHPPPPSRLPALDHRAGRVLSSLSQSGGAVGQSA